MVTGRVVRQAQEGTPVANVPRLSRVASRAVLGPTSATYSACAPSGEAPRRPGRAGGGGRTSGKVGTMCRTAVARCAARRRVATNRRRRSTIFFLWFFE